MYRIIFRLYVWGRESNLQYNNKQKLQQSILQILFALLFIFKHQITTTLPLKKKSEHHHYLSKKIKKAAKQRFSVRIFFY